MTPQQAHMADQIGLLQPGQAAQINGHQVARLDREVETFSVDGAACCFFRAWELTIQDPA